MLSHALDHVTFHSECKVAQDDLAGLPTTDMTSLLHSCNLVLASYKIYNAATCVVCGMLRG